MTYISQNLSSKDILYEGSLRHKRNISLKWSKFDLQ